MIARLRTWWQGRTLRRLERRVVQQADAALRAHARGDKTEYIRLANDAKNTSAIVRALRSS